MIASKYSKIARYFLKCPASMMIAEKAYEFDLTHNSKNKYQYKANENTV